MTEAVKTVTRFGLRDMKVTQVCAYTELENHASQSVLLKAGFVKSTHDEETYKFISP